MVSGIGKGSDQLQPKGQHAAYLFDHQTQLHEPLLTKKELYLGMSIQPAIHLFSNANSDAAKAYAAQLAKETGTQIQTVDLSAHTSTDSASAEKNLDHVLTEAEQKGSILFFDEADSLFGKRTGVQDSHDKYANAEISWLLTRISQYKGLIVLASDQSFTIDPELFHRSNMALRHH